MLKLTPRGENAIARRHQLYTMYTISARRGGYAVGTESICGFADQLKLDRCGGCASWPTRRSSSHPQRRDRLVGPADRGAARPHAADQPNARGAREALAIAEHEGLTERLPYKGIFVKVVTVDEAS